MMNEIRRVWRRRPVVAGLALALLVSGAGAGCTLVPVAPADSTPAQVLPGPGDGVATSTLMDRDRNKLFDRLDAELQALPPDQPVPVIVVTTEPVGEADLFKALGDRVRPTHIYSLLPGFAASLMPDQIGRLAKQDWVLQIEPDEPVYLLMDSAARHTGAVKARADFGVDGDGNGSPGSYSTGDVVVAIIDTGIDPNHADLAGKIVGWNDWVGGRPTPYDDHGHGTHVAGIAAGAGAADGRFRGMAPGAALVGLKVLDARGSGSLSSVAAAVEWAVENRDRYRIRVMNMSLGTAGSSDGTDSVSLAVNRAAEAGIAVVAAAGNSGPNPATVGSPGAADGAITVAAMADPGENGFHLAPFSSRGPTRDGRVKPDVAAPGVNISAPQAGTPSGYISFSGTSMATPFVAGTVALLLDANPALGPLDVRGLLQETARDWGVPGNDFDYGAGVVDVYAAIRAAIAGTGTGPVVPGHVTLSGHLLSGQQVEHTVTVTDPSWPLAVTLLMPGWAGRQSPDLDLYVVGPGGTELGRSTGVTRQETVTARISQAGEYRIRVVSYVGAGDYVLDVSAGIAPGDGPPTLSFLSPAEGETVRGVVPVRVQAGDDVGVSRVELAIDGGPFQTMGRSGGDYGRDWDSAAVADGPHTLAARATDSSGQQAEALRRVQVQNGSRLFEKRMNGRVAPGQPDAWLEVDVGAEGLLDLVLSWSTGADLDFYVYGPQGVVVGRAFTLRNPEQLRVATERFGTGLYRIRVNLYSGPATDFSLRARGLGRTTYTGTVTQNLPGAVHAHPVALAGTGRVVLSWGTGADLDFFVHDPVGTVRARAFTLRNPESVELTLEPAGNWHVRVNLYSGVNTTYTLKFYAPAPILG